MNFFKIFSNVFYFDIKSGSNGFVDYLAFKIGHEGLNTKSKWILN